MWKNAYKVYFFHVVYCICVFLYSCFPPHKYLFIPHCLQQGIENHARNEILNHNALIWENQVTGSDDKRSASWEENIAARHFVRLRQHWNIKLNFPNTSTSIYAIFITSIFCVLGRESFNRTFSPILVSCVDYFHISVHIWSHVSFISVLYFIGVYFQCGVKIPTYGTDRLVVYILNSFFFLTHILYSCSRYAGYIMFIFILSVHQPRLSQAHFRLTCRSVA